MREIVAFGRSIVSSSGMGVGRSVCGCKLIISTDAGLSILWVKARTMCNGRGVKCGLFILGNTRNPFVFVSELCWD